VRGSGFAGVALGAVRDEGVAPPELGCFEEPRTPSCGVSVFAGVALGAVRDEGVAPPEESNCPENLMQIRVSSAVDPLNYGGCAGLTVR